MQGESTQLLKLLDALATMPQKNEAAESFGNLLASVKPKTCMQIGHNLLSHRVNPRELRRTRNSPRVKGLEAWRPNSSNMFAALLVVRCRQHAKIQRALSWKP